MEKEQAKVDFFDPWVMQYRENGKVRDGLKEITPELIASYDLVMITTAHSNVDYMMVQGYAKAVFDTKNVMKNIQPRDNIEVL